MTQNTLSILTILARNTKLYQIIHNYNQHIGIMVLLSTHNYNKNAAWVPASYTAHCSI